MRHQRQIQGISSEFLQAVAVEELGMDPENHSCIRRAARRARPFARRFAAAMRKGHGIGRALNRGAVELDGEPGARAVFFKFARTVMVAASGN